MFIHTGTLAILESLHRNWDNVIDGVLFGYVYIVFAYGEV